MAQVLAPAMVMITPEDIQRLPVLNDETKPLYIAGLTKLWKALEDNPEESEKHQTALGKITAISRDIARKVANWEGSSPIGKFTGRPRSHLQGQNQMPLVS